MPKCWIIAGPNGAGKTTFAMTFLPEVVNCHRFINADSIALGLNPLEPGSETFAASRIFLREFKEALTRTEDFGFETTLSGKSYLRQIKKMQTAGWHVELVYLALSSAEISKQRVAERVAHGGHDIPEPDLERRFPRSLQNLFGAIGNTANMKRSIIVLQRHPQDETKVQSIANHRRNPRVPPADGANRAGAKKSPRAIRRGLERRKSASHRAQSRADRLHQKVVGSVWFLAHFTLRVAS